MIPAPFLRRPPAGLRRDSGGAPIPSAHAPVFLLKKFVSLALDPFLVGLVLLLAGVGLLWLRPGRRLGRVLVTAGVVVQVLFGLAPVGYLLTVPLEDRYRPAVVTQDVRDARYVAVLGGGHVESPGLPAVQQLSLVSLGRLAEGVRIFQLLDSATLIVSGYRGPQPTPHAVVSAEAAASLGVPPERIIRLPRPRDTAEELAAIEDIVGDRPFVLVTSAIHMPRAMEAARRQGLRAVPAPATFMARGAPRASQMVVPNPGALARTSAALHEYVGRIWYAVSAR